MRRSVKERLVTNTESGECFSYAEALRLNGQAIDSEASGELAPVNEKRRPQLPRS